MKLSCLVFGICAFSLTCAFGDLTIVQNVEGIGPATQMTMKIKGDKARVDISPQISTIFDSKTGDVINLMRDQKMVVRMSADKIKAATEMMRKSQGQPEGAAKPKIVPTGKKEMFNGYQTEQYTCDSPSFKATYWIAAGYPDGATILRQLQAVKMDALSGSNSHMPDYRDIPGVPVKTVLSFSGKQITSTLNSIKQDAISDSEFSVPADYKEMNIPDILRGAKAAPPAPTP